MSNNSTSQTNTGRTEPPVATAVPIHEVAAVSEPINSLDEPPPAYDINPTSINNQTNSEIDTLATAAGTIEAPPPYCLVDPTKIRSTDRLPHYSQVTPVEVIDLNASSNMSNDPSSRHSNQAVIAAWLASGSSMDIGTDCTFLMAFVIAFFFNWLGFLAVVCLIPTIAARFGAMSGFGLSVAKWITVMRYHEFNNTAYVAGTNVPGAFHRQTPHDPAQNFVFAIVLFAGFFLFVRGLISYIAVKNRANQHGQTADVFTWY